MIFLHHFRAFFFPLKSFAKEKVEACSRKDVIEYLYFCHEKVISILYSRKCRNPHEVRLLHCSVQQASSVNSSTAMCSVSSVYGPQPFIEANTMRKQFENLLHLTCLPIQFNIYMVLIISSKQFYCPCGMVCHISMTANKHFFRFCSIILPMSISNVCTVSYMYLSIICKFNTHMHKYSMCHRKDQQPTALLP